MSLRSLLASSAVVLVLTAVLAGTSAYPSDTVRIGVVAPLTGPRAYLGEEIVNGARLALEDLERGVLDGFDVELVVVDDADLIQLPTQLAQLSEREHVSALIGPEAPGILLGARTPLSRRDVPALLPAAFAGDLSDAPTTVIRTIPSARVQAARLGHWFAEQRGMRRVAVLVADPVEGGSVAQEVEAGLRVGGIEAVEVSQVPGDAPRLQPAVAELRGRMRDAEAVVLWGPPPVAARATLAVRGLAWDVQLAVPASAFVAEYRTLAGAASEGVVLAFPFREEWFRGTDLMTWLLRYHREHGLGALPQLDTLVLDVPVVAAASYDAVRLVGEAVAAADTRAPADVADALLEVDYDGVLKEYRGLRGGEAWDLEELHVARFHHFATTFDVDPRLDTALQRRIWELQISADYLPDEVLEGPAGDLIRALVSRRGPAPDYQPPLPPPGPVARP